MKKHPETQENNVENQEPSVMEQIGIAIDYLLSDRDGEPSVPRVLATVAAGFYGLKKQPLATSAAIITGIACLDRAMKSGHVKHTGNKQVRKALREFSINHLGGKPIHSDE